MGASLGKDKDVDVTGNDALVDCPVLVDLGHGTIRHRQPDEKVQDSTAKIKTGYFYHARLDDFSEDAVVNSDDQFKFKYVFQGPAKSTGKRLYYVYGNNINAQDSGIQRGDYKPKGKGFNWPESYRKANNLYYDLTIIPRGSEEYETDDDNISLSTDISNANEITNSDKDNITLRVRVGDTVEMVKKRIAIRLLIPAVNLHFLFNKKELDNEDAMTILAQSDEEMKQLETLHINFKLL